MGRVSLSNMPIPPIVHCGIMEKTSLNARFLISKGEWPMLQR